MHSLLKVTEQRKREDEILFEKRVVKELEEEQAETEGVEKFVTSAYKRQLQANKKWLEEKAIEDAKIMADDVRNKDGISDFYTNMLKGKNKATGATVRGASPPREEPPKGSPCSCPPCTSTSACFYVSLSETVHLSVRPTVSWLTALLLYLLCVRQLPAHTHILSV